MNVFEVDMKKFILYSLSRRIVKVFFDFCLIRRMIKILFIRIEVKFMNKYRVLYKWFNNRFIFVLVICVFFV